MNKTKRENGVAKASTTNLLTKINRAIAKFHRIIKKKTDNKVLILF